MANNRVYSDEEFALILRTATEMSGRAEVQGSSPSGLTLSEMQAAAAQVGIDPVLVAQAARQHLVRKPPALLERLIGGPLRLQHAAHFPVMLDEPMATRLLSAVRITEGHAAGIHAGHASALGMTWHDGGELEALTVTVHPVADGVDAAIAMDRRGTLTTVAAFAGFGVLMAALAGMTWSETAPVLGVSAGVVGAGGVLAIARRYWVSSTNAVRTRMGAVMDTIGRALPASGASDRSE